MRKPKADCRTCREEAQKTQELRKQGPFLWLLRFFAAIPDFCNFLPIIVQTRICGLAAGAATLAFQFGMNWPCKKYVLTRLWLHYSFCSRSRKTRADANNQS